MNYTIELDGEFYTEVRDIHVDSAIEDLELQGFNIVDVTWDDVNAMVYLTTEEEEE